MTHPSKRKGNMSEGSEVLRARCKRLESLFRKLRDEWFVAKLMEPPHDRDWQSIESDSEREDTNAENRRLYEAQTIMLVAGLAGTVAPYCMADVEMDMSQ